MLLDYFLDICCDMCGSRFQSSSYQGVIDIIREHLREVDNKCRVENMKISPRTSDKRDRTSDYNQIKYENKLIREHDLVPVEFNGVMA